MTMEQIINGITVRKLEKFMDERGFVAHFMPNDDPDFEKFGQVYFAACFPGEIKGWHLHKKTTLNYAVIVGNAKFVMCDMRDGSPTKGNIREVFMGENNYVRLKVPPGVANAWTPVGGKTAILGNCSTELYDPDEMTRIDPFDYGLIPYKWGIKHG